MSNPARRTHIQSAHEGVRFQCDECDYVATTAGRLKVHKKAKHEGILFYCDLCEHSTGRRSDLKRHKKTRHKVCDDN